MSPEQLSLLGDDGPQRPARDERLPPDQAARDRTATDLSRTLFVEAGAGSGKTRALVDRILSLVDSGVDLDHIAAITFTEKAAAELRHRVRARLETAAAAADNDDASGDRDGAERAARALTQLDGAAISTLHAFAQRLLFEHPIEAGLPPGVEVLDEIASQVDFDERWQNALPDLFDDPAMAAPLLLADVFGIAVGDLRSLATQLESDWDLVAERMPTTMPPIEADVGPTIDAIRGLAPLLDDCRDHDDKLAVRITECLDHADALAQVVATPGDDIDRLVDLAELLALDKPAFSTNGSPYSSLGSKRNWSSPEAHDAAKLALFDAGEVRAIAQRNLATAVVNVLARRIGDLVLDAAEQRRVEGRLRFHDLLVLARELLRSPEHGLAVRTSVHDRYQRLLIDEFQDTDPIQVELATRIAAPPDHDADAEWTDIPTDAGHLFFVGDPKQSIYRFRRADIAVYLRAQKHFGGPDGTVALTTNFRSTAPIIDWVNHVFGRLITAVPDAQPHYRALTAWRSAPPSGPGVAIVGAAAHETTQRADDLRRHEAADVVAAIATAMEQRWPVADPDAGTDAWRDPRLGDITILLPARTSLPALERALEDASIPYRAESASLVYSTPEVRDLLLVARAIDDPTEELATVAALRTSALGCGDDDLLHYRQVRGGGWNHQAISAELPGSDPVVAGMRWMASVHTQRAWRSPAQILDGIVADRRLLELGVTDHRHREVWRRLRFVIDQARAWTDTTGGNLREYLAWARLQASESARVAETILPESDADAVRIMTIHGSKGLEFPITIVSGLTTRPQGRHQAVTVLWPPDGPPGFRMRGGTVTPEYEAFAPIDELLDAHERLRLLYVACTRARDHLVVSMHRNDSGSERSLAVQLGSVGAHDAAEPLVAAPRPPSPGTWSEPVVEPVDLPPRDEWLARRTAAITNGSRSRTIAATTLAELVADEIDPALDKGGRDLDLPPWQKGRYGTAVGRAVHAVLQSAELRPDASLRSLANAQAAAEGVHDQRDVIERLARSALRSEVITEAAAARHWRELFVAAPLGDRLLEGYIDLLFRRGDDVVVVDYKTDAWGSIAELDAKVDRYRLQTAAYALALESATGLHVAEAVLLFLAEDQATPRVVVDLDHARADVARMAPAVLLSGEAGAND